MSGHNAPSRPATPGLTRHDLYELCVQSPRHLVPFLRAVHCGDPRVLGEDFAGTAALSALWADQSADHLAVAVDLDADALRHHPEHPRVLRRCTDVMEAADPADVIFVGNFSIGYRHTRPDLIAYLKHARQRLTILGREHGVFICDTYGGESAFLTGEVHRDHWIPDGPHAGERIRYTWEQRHADPLTGMVTDVLHFRVEKGGVIGQEFLDAFVYEWRLWSVPELRDAMLEAGFATTEVYAKTADAVDGEGNAYVLPVEDPEELDDSFIVLVAGHV